MIILASGSPRRQELLTMVGINFKVVKSNFDETSVLANKVEELPLLEAIEKASLVAKDFPNDTIIGSDTGVIIDDIMLGKPKDKDDARRMIKLLSNRSHKVVTGVCIIKNGEKHLISSVSEVTFFDLDEKTIEDYINTSEPYDKAGAYAIQGKGAILIKNIKGDYYTIMGLPLASVYYKLKELKEI